MNLKSKLNLQNCKQASLYSKKYSRNRIVQILPYKQMPMIEWKRKREINCQNEKHINVWCTLDSFLLSIVFSQFFFKLLENGRKHTRNICKYVFLLHKTTLFSYSIEFSLKYCRKYLQSLIHVVLGDDTGMSSSQDFVFSNNVRNLMIFILY